MKHENMNEYALPFAAWELRLYLDTHPEDECALREYRRLCNMAGGKCNYACHTPDGHVMPHGGATPYAGARGNVNGNGCGCDASTTRENVGGGNYGGNRCDNGNYRTARAENGVGGGCGCGGDNNDNSTTNGYNVWSWVDGPWPWEPEANGGGC